MSISYEAKLNTGWSLWEHQRNLDINYDQNSCCIGNIEYVEEFWNYYNNYPQPSEIFYDGICKPTLTNPDREIAAISFFRNGIEPKWEDEKNVNGGEFSLRNFKNTEIMDKMWELLSVWCISEVDEFSEYVTGIRIVDSSIVKNRRKLYRIELWFSDLSKRENLEIKFRNLLDIDEEESINFKEHSTAVETSLKKIKPHKYEDRCNR